jgi:hypothetical protein
MLTLRTGGAGPSGARTCAKTVEVGNASGLTQFGGVGDELPVYLPLHHLLQECAFLDFAELLFGFPAFSWMLNAQGVFEGF